MTGVKGRSGGARANAGGARPGAGRKPKEKVPKAPPTPSATRDPLEFLLDVMQGVAEANMMQVRAAIAAAQYVHVKRADGGKKDDQADKAKKAGAGKFASAAPPRLAAAGGKKV